MIAFIRQEAREKAEEIRVKTESAFMAEKLNLKTQASIKIRDDYEQKKKNALVSKKIARSKEINSSRMSVMKNRNDKVEDLKQQVTGELAKLSKHPKYPDLIKFLLAEGFMAVMEEYVTIQCRKEDEAIVKAQLAGAIELFQQQIRDATGKTVAVNTQIDSDYLPSGPGSGKGESCCGGVVLHANGRKLICRNTLDSRLELAFHDLSPQVRGGLFGERGKPVTAH